MINVSGKDLMRAGQKIGYIQGNDIFSHEGRKLGYVQGNHVFNRDGQKLAYLQDDHIYHAHDSQKTRIEDNHQQVSGGEISDVQRAAVRVLLGD